jgi:coenzyme F420-reducing hydrogenase alpha subunit
MKRITIEPVSRLEGHATITIHLDDLVLVLQPTVPFFITTRGSSKSSTP